MWNAWPFLLKVPMAIGLVFLLSSLGTWFVGDSSEFPAWLGAVSTAFAFLAAMYAARYAARMWVLETVREERAQAALVAGWYDQKTVGSSGKLHATEEPEGHPALVGESYTVTGIYLRNASQVPVTDVRYRLFIGDGPISTPVSIGLLPPSTEPVFAEIPSGEVKRPEGQPLRVGLRPTVELEFRDAAGLRWQRDPEGRLHRLRD